MRGSGEVRRRTDLVRAAAYPDLDIRRNQKEGFMNIIIWLVVGGLIGWVASMLTRTNVQEGIMLNVIVGIVGAALGGWLLTPLSGVSTINQNDFSTQGLAVSLLGAVILLAAVNLFRRGTAG